MIHDRVPKHPSQLQKQIPQRHKILTPAKKENPTSQSWYANDKEKKMEGKKRSRCESLNHDQDPLYDLSLLANYKILMLLQHLLNFLPNLLQARSQIPVRLNFINLPLLGL